MGQQKFTRKNIQIYDAQRRQENKRKRRVIVYVSLFLAVSLVFIAVCVAVFLKIDKILIKGNERYSDDQIWEYIPIKKGDNIFAFKAKEIEANINLAYPYIDKVEIKRDFPSTVIVNIEEASPYYYAKIAGDNYYISSELKVLEKLPADVLPDAIFKELKLNNVKKCVVGNSIDFVDKRTYDAISELNDLFVEYGLDNKISRIDIRSRFDIYFDYNDRFEIYLGDMENAEVKIRFLVEIFNELGENATGTIDISDPREAAVALS